MKFEELICSIVGHRYQRTKRDPRLSSDSLDLFLRCCARCGHVERMTAAEREKIRAMVGRIMAGLQ